MRAAHHKVGAGITVTTFVAIHDLSKHGRITERTVLCGVLATQFASIPDWIEPYTCPNHRKFFHSVFVLGLVAYGGYKLYQWEAEEDWQKFLSGLGW